MSKSNRGGLPDPGEPSPAQAAALEATQQLLELARRTDDRGFLSETPGTVDDEPADAVAEPPTTRQPAMPAPAPTHKILLETKEFSFELLAVEVEIQEYFICVGLPPAAPVLSSKNLVPMLLRIGGRQYPVFQIGGCFKLARYGLKLMMFLRNKNQESESTTHDQRRENETEENSLNSDESSGG